eukprot:346293-Chlamydomonas_euryale.AAC.1
MDTCPRLRCSTTAPSMSALSVVVASDDCDGGVEGGGGCGGEGESPSCAGGRPSEPCAGNA